MLRACEYSVDCYLLLRRDFGMWRASGFTTDARVCWLRVYTIPECLRNVFYID